MTSTKAIEMYEYKALKRDLEKSLSSFGYDQSTLEDLFHDTYIRFLDLPETPENHRAWFFRAMKNRAIDESRRFRNRHLDVMDDQKHQIESKADDYAQFESSKDLEFLLSSIDNTMDLALLKAFYVDDESLESLAGRYQMPLNTIKVRKHRALKKLQSHVFSLVSIH